MTSIIWNQDCKELQIEILWKLLYSYIESIKRLEISDNGHLNAKDCIEDRKFKKTYFFTLKVLKEKKNVSNDFPRKQFAFVFIFIF